MEELNTKIERIYGHGQQCGDCGGGVVVEMGIEGINGNGRNKITCLVIPYPYLKGL